MDPFPLVIFLLVVLGMVITMTVRVSIPLPCLPLKPAPAALVALDPSSPAAAPTRRSLRISYTLLPLIGCIVLLAGGAITWKDVWEGGLAGDSRIQPYAILVIFMGLAYVCISLDFTGFLAYVSLKVVIMAGGSPRRLFIAFFLLAAGVTVLTSNDIVVLTVSPVVVYCARFAGFDPIPHLTAIFFAANSFSIIFLISNPTNVIISEAVGVTFAEYARYMVVPAAATAAAGFVALYLIFRSELGGSVSLPALSPRDELKSAPGAVAHGITLACCLCFMAASSFVSDAVRLWMVAGAAAVVSFVSNSVLLPWRLPSPVAGEEGAVTFTDEDAEEVSTIAAPAAGTGEVDHEQEDEEMKVGFKLAVTPASSSAAPTAATPAPVAGATAVDPTVAAAVAAYAADAAALAAEAASLPVPLSVDFVPLPSADSPALVAAVAHAHAHALGHGHDGWEGLGPAAAAAGASGAAHTDAAGNAIAEGACVEGAGIGVGEDGVVMLTGRGRALSVSMLATQPPLPPHHMSAAAAAAAAGEIEEEEAEVSMHSSLRPTYANSKGQAKGQGQYIGYGAEIDSEDPSDLDTPTAGAAAAAAVVAGSAAKNQQPKSRELSIIKASSVYNGDADSDSSFDHTAAAPGTAPAPAAAAAAPAAASTPAVAAPVKPQAHWPLLKSLPWPLLPFVCGMFILVQALAKGGWVDAGARWIVDALGGAGSGESGGDIISSSLLLFVVTTLLSNLANNQPAAILLARVLTAPPAQALPPKVLRAGVFSAVAGTNLAACLTPLGALAGVLFLSVLRLQGVNMGYWTFVKRGLVTVPVAGAVAALTIAAMVAT